MLETSFVLALAFQGLPTAYDSHYLALAEGLDADLWTLDERFATRARSRYPRVRVVGSP